MLLLGGVNRRLWRHQACLRVSFDLDEAEHTLVPSNHVDFAVIVRCAEILGHDAIPQAAQVKVSFHFTTVGSLQVRGLRLPKVSGR